MKTYRRKAIAETSQASVQRLKKYRETLSDVKSCIAKVIDIHSDSNTCDVEPLRGGRKYSVPILTKGGLINDEVYGELELPQPGDFVVVLFVASNEAQPFVLGTVLPYMHSKFQSSQQPVNSASKQFTKKLLQKGKEKTFRKIFKSGTTIEVQEDGSVIIETPSGQYVQIDEVNSKVIINNNFEVDK